MFGRPCGNRLLKSAVRHNSRLTSKREVTAADDPEAECREARFLGTNATGELITSGLLILSRHGTLEETSTAHLSSDQRRNRTRQSVD